MGPGLVRSISSLISSDTLFYILREKEENGAEQTWICQLNQTWRPFKMQQLVNFDRHFV